MMVKVVGYVRRSTDKQDLSLEQQAEQLSQFAKAKGWNIVKVYSDDAISGSELNRPGLGALLTDIETRKDISAVIVWDRNRLARPKDPVDGILLERKIFNAEKRIFYASTGQEADRSFTSGLIGYIEHHQNGDYLRKLSRDTMRGLVDRAKHGLWTGGPIPYGYDRLVYDSQRQPKKIVRDMPDKTQLIIDVKTEEIVERISGNHRYRKQDHEVCGLVPSEPDRVNAVKKMFSDYAAGIPIRKIRDEFNRCGLRTYRGRPITVQTIHHMLENEAYIGQCVYNKRTESKWHCYIEGQSIEREKEGLQMRPETDWIVKEDAWPALVEKEVYDIVQKRRKESKDRHRQVFGSSIRSEYLLTGIAFCGVCGGKLVGQNVTSGKGYMTRYYICGTHHRGDHEECPKRYTVPAKMVEQHIINLIKEDLQNLKNDPELMKYVQEELAKANDLHSGAKKNFQCRLAQLDQEAAKIRDHLTKLDTETAEMLGLYDQAKEINAERKKIEAELTNAGADVPDFPDMKSIKQAAQGAFLSLDRILGDSSIEEKREMIRTYVQNIKADPNFRTVEISLYPALFNKRIAGTGFEPVTSGL